MNRNQLQLEGKKGLVFEIEGNELIDSLPYIDDALSLEEKQQVDQLIKAEAKLMQPKDYLATLPTTPSTLSIQQQHQLDTRALQLLNNTNNIHNNNYNINNNNNNNIQYFQETLKQRLDQQQLQKLDTQVKLQRQHTQIQRLNLELLHKQGDKQWQEYLHYLQHLAHHHQHTNTHLQFTLDEINAQRKYHQLQAFQMFKQYHQSNTQIHQATLQLQHQCQQLQASIQDVVRKQLKIN